MLNYQFQTLDSGLRLVTIPMEATKAATVLVLVGTGSKYETKETNGVSHFLEHMMFKGTTKRPGYLDISRELESLGAQFNAFTSKEYTGYYAKASADKVDVIMDVIFDIYQNSKLDEAAIQTERHVGVEEINMTVLNLKRENLVDYFNTHYTAQNTIVAIAGNIDPEKIRDKVSAHFSQIRLGALAAKAPVIENQAVPQVALHYKETDQTNFVLGFRAYSMKDDKRYALGGLASILGGGMSSRLVDEVREKRGLAYYISAGQQIYTDTGYIEISAGVNNEKVLEAVGVVMAEIQKVRKEGVTPLELRQAIDKAIGRTALALEHSDYIAESLAESILFQNQVLTPLDRLDKIKKVTLADIQGVAAEIFEAKRLNLAIVGPFKDPEPFRKLLTL